MPSGLRQRVERLVLGRRRRLPFHRQVAQKRLHLGLRRLQLLPAIHPVKLDIPLDPVPIRPFRPQRRVLEPHHLPHLVQQPRLEIGNHPFPTSEPARPPTSHPTLISALTPLLLRHTLLHVQGTWNDSQFVG
jgi:hypothetical protein